MAQFAIPYVEERYGFERARHEFAKVLELKERFKDYDRAPWNVETHQSQSYPFLFRLGMKGKHPCSGFKIHIFTVDEGNQPIRCSQGMFASEVFFHRWVMHSDCATDDPEEADYFFVPFYSACISTKDEKIAKEMNAMYLNQLKREDIAKYYKRRDGRDFIFLWSSECYDFPEWDKYVARSVFLNVEGLPIQCDDIDFFNEQNSEKFGQHCTHCLWCSHEWKDIIIPGFIEKWSIDRLIARDRDYRSLIACYHGSDSTEMSIYRYANTTVRNTIQSLNEYSGLSVGRRFPIVTEYFDRIGECSYCFVPKGLGYWSNRLYEIVFAGCIPVILSDEIRLPFPDFIEWEKISLKFPTKDFERDPYHYVQMLHHLYQDKNEEVHRMRVRLRKARCWLNYHSFDPECSPYIAIARQLELKKAAFPKFLGKKWGPKVHQAREEL